jgi:hypothetical protein
MVKLTGKSKGTLTSRRLHPGMHKETVKLFAQFDRHRVLQEFFDKASGYPQHVSLAPEAFRTHRSSVETHLDQRLGQIREACERE